MPDSSKTRASAVRIESRTTSDGAFNRFRAAESPAGTDDRQQSGEELKTRVAPEVEQAILQAVRSIRYGSVEVIIHDAAVVQIERKEKLRFTRIRSVQD